jgi:hypothetical protein
MRLALSGDVRAISGLSYRVSPVIEFRIAVGLSYRFGK